jgi:UDP-N-acetylmuramyl pentapeptide synthase
VLYTQGNLNNHIGVPLTLLGLTEEHEMAVVEMGANHPGEIRTLVHIAEPDCGLITNVGKAHLEGFGSFEGVVKTKSELYDYLRKKENAFIFLSKPLHLLKNRQVVFIMSFKSLYLHIKIIEYGTTFSGAIKTQKFR